MILAYKGEKQERTKVLDTVSTPEGVVDYAPGYSEYVDVQSVYEEPTFPKMYKEPADPVMPSSLNKYLINKADIGEKVAASEIEGALDHYGEFQKEMENPSTLSEWKTVKPQSWYQGEKRDRWSKNVLKILKLDPDKSESYETLDYWRQIASIGSINSRSDSDRIRKTIREYGGILPDKPPKGIQID